MQQAVDFFQVRVFCRGRQKSPIHDVIGKQQVIGMRFSKRLKRCF
jgi:hypothetical protein